MYRDALCWPPSPVHLRRMDGKGGLTEISASEECATATCLHLVEINALLSSVLLSYLTSALLTPIQCPADSLNTASLTPVLCPTYS